MRCSSSERLLDEFVDGTLSAPDHARVAEHLETCVECASILEELRVIDALLLQPRRLETVPNFTFKVMADVRGLPIPHAHRRFSFEVLGAYVAFAWVAIGAFLFFGGAPVRASLVALGYGLTHGSKHFGSLANATGQVFGAHTYGVVAAMGALLGLDLLAALAVLFVLSTLRARRLATERSLESW